MHRNVVDKYGEDYTEENNFKKTAVDFPIRFLKPHYEKNYIVVCVS